MEVNMLIQLAQEWNQREIINRSFVSCQQHSSETIQLEFQHSKKR